jgi:dTMP kinase
MRGKFIVLDGPDGAGTTTHATLLAEHLKKQGHDVLLTAEPTTGDIGKWIRKQLTAKAPLTPMSLQLLFCADRAWHIEAIVEPALRQGKTVICDRYYPSTIVYAQAQGVPADVLQMLNNNFLQPDCIIFTLPPLEVSVGRVAERKEKDLFHSRELQKRIHEGYERMASENSDIKSVDTSKDKPVAAQEIADIVKQCL